MIRMGASSGIYTPTVGPSAAQGTAILDPFNPYLYPPMQDSPIWPGSLMNADYVIAKGVPVDWLNGARFGSAACRRFQHGLLRRLGPYDHV